MTWGGRVNEFCFTFSCSFLDFTKHENVKKFIFSYFWWNFLKWYLSTRKNKENNAFGALNHILFSSRNVGCNTSKKTTSLFFFVVWILPGLQYSSFFVNLWTFISILLEKIIFPTLVYLHMDTKWRRYWHEEKNIIIWINSLHKTFLYTSRQSKAERKSESRAFFLHGCHAQHGFFTVRLTLSYLRKFIIRFLVFRLSVPIFLTLRETRDSREIFYQEARLTQKIYSFSD